MSVDLVERIERNRFVGREFLLWLWFESEVFETNLAPTGQARCALWIEARLTLSFEKDESVLKSASPAASPEAKEALRQGKLPREARLRLTDIGLDDGVELAVGVIIGRIKGDGTAAVGVRVVQQRECSCSRIDACHLEGEGLVRKYEGQQLR